VLAVTPRIRVGVGILPAAARNPAFAAMEVATLGQLFPGRVDVGVGHGMPDWMRAVGAWTRSPLRVLEECLTTVSALLRGEEAGGTRLEPACVPEVAPRVLAGVRGPKSLALSGRAADGTVLAEPVTPEYIRVARGHVAAADHHLVGYNLASVDDSAEAAVDAVRPGLEWVGEPDWAPHIAPLPFADGLAALRRDCADRAEFVRRLPAEWVAQLALAGTPDSVRARIAALRSAGLDSPVLVPVGDPTHALESLAAVL
jgi:alkanesulfonate monooxygenase SsuD/methylene tetrahydromethanopterin reductase-like flavin-dependent oxidoreductase (luciferase family)